MRETKRPLEGYALDSRTYAVTVADRSVTRVNTTAVSDKAKLNPLSLLIQKKDAQRDVYKRQCFIHAAARGKAYQFPKTNRWMSWFSMMTKKPRNRAIPASDI